MSAHVVCERVEGPPTMLDWLLDKAASSGHLYDVESRVMAIFVAEPDVEECWINYNDLTSMEVIFSRGLHQEDTVYKVVLINDDEFTTDLGSF